MNDSEKKQVAASLIAAACADGQLHPVERQRITTLMDDLGGGDVFRAAIANPITPEELGSHPLHAGRETGRLPARRAGVHRGRAC